MSAKWNSFQEAMLFDNEKNWSDFRKEYELYFEKNPQFNDSFQKLLSQKIITISNFLCICLGIKLLLLLLF